MSSNPAGAGIGAIVLDIEGTTTPIAFVTHVLVPYARRHLRSYLERHTGSTQYESLLNGLRGEHESASDDREAVPPWVDEPPAERAASVAIFVEWLMDRDRKSTALKELQGMIWEEGYQRGELVGDVYPDVPRALRHWHEQHLAVAIFSSGSVLAQQLLFRHSSHGDLTGCIRQYFDTQVGTKVEADSYRRIASAVGLPAETVLFLSDVTRELDAAREAGMHVRLAVRPGNTPPIEQHGYEAIRSLDELVDLGP